MPDLDLTGGSPRPSSGPGPRGQSASAAAETARRKAEEALTNELTDVFGRIAALMEARNDEELATAFEEDKRVLSTGLVSLTKTVTPLRPPLVLAVHLVEPFLAFGRIIGILARRLRDRFAYQEEEQPVQP